MLQTQSKSANISTLIAFKPRQVMLANPNMKNKPCSLNGSTDKEAFTLKPDQKTLLLHSILDFLQRNGFSKTFKKFRSEANLDENYKSCSLDLEEMYYKCLETHNHADTNLEGCKKQDLQTDGITKTDECGDCVVSVDTVSNKKKKKSDSNAINQPGPADKFKNTNPEGIVTYDLAPESNVKSKEKKKSKKSFDTVSQGTEQVSSEVLKEPADDIACEQQLDEYNEKCKNKKKKKNKLVSETLVDNVEHHQLKALPGMTEDKFKELVSSEGKSTTDADINNKSKDKKRKKDKPASESLVDRQAAITSTFEDVEHSINSQVVDSTMVNANDIPSEEKNIKSKGKKRKKDVLVSESLPGGDMEDLEKGKLRTDPKKDDFQTLEEDATEQSKCSKKRKRLASEENDSHFVDRVAIEEWKYRKTEGLEESKEKEENGNAGFNNSEKTSIKQLGTQENGILERNGEKSSVKKQRNGSVEPKTVNAFQRVKVDKVEFVDERLQDNSYWAKDGAEIGYGAKAQEVLGQVRGRDFRHEKTKKKRGSYRGGQIDLQSHSVKFSYSDD